MREGGANVVDDVDVLGDESEVREALCSGGVRCGEIGSADFGPVAGEAGHSMTSATLFRWHQHIFDACKLQDSHDRDQTALHALSHSL